MRRFTREVWRIVWPWWLAFGLLAVGTQLTHAGQESLAWDYTAGATVTGFKGYCGTVSGQYAAQPAWTVGAQVRTVTATFPAGRQYCVVRAYDAAGESGNSNEVTFIERPGNLRLTVTMTWNEQLQRYVLTTSRLVETP